MIHKAWWTLIAGGGLAGLALGVAASYFWPAAYTSEVQLQIFRPQIPRSLLASGDVFDLDSFVSQARATISHNIEIEKFDHPYDQATAPGLRVWKFYRHLRAGKKAVALEEEINKALRIERSGDLVRVAFTYRDYPPAPDDAVKASTLADLSATIVMSTITWGQQAQAWGNVQFFKGRTASAAMSWEQLNNQIRDINASDPHFDRLVLDRELARNEYASVRQKLSEAEGIQEGASQNQGWRLGVNAPSNTPEGPDVSQLQIALSGLGGGRLLGFIAWLRSAMRGLPSVLLSAEAAPGD